MINQMKTLQNVSKGCLSIDVFNYLGHSTLCFSSYPMYLKYKQCKNLYHPLTCKRNGRSHLCKVIIFGLFFNVHLFQKGDVFRLIVCNNIYCTIFVLKVLSQIFF